MHRPYLRSRGRSRGRSRASSSPRPRRNRKRQEPKHDARPFDRASSWLGRTPCCKG